jgi:dihydropteroate synthase
MGILNVNSFFLMVESTIMSDLLNQVGKMISDGATFIDIGAYSSKPSAEFVSENEELGRIVPVVQLILKHFPEALLSIDTFRSEVNLYRKWSGNHK